MLQKGQKQSICVLLNQCEAICCGSFKLRGRLLSILSISDSNILSVFLFLLFPNSPVGQFSSQFCLLVFMVIIISSLLSGSQEIDFIFCRLWTFEGITEKKEPANRKLDWYYGRRWHIHTRWDNYHLQETCQQEKDWKLESLLFYSWYWFHFVNFYLRNYVVLRCINSEI